MCLGGLRATIAPTGQLIDVVFDEAEEKLIKLYYTKLPPSKFVYCNLLLFDLTAFALTSELWGTVL